MIKYLVMDVDGTLTNGKIYISEYGEAIKAFSVKDGYGIHDIAIQKGIIPVIITGRTSKIVENRCKELGITQLYQGISNKADKLGSMFLDLSDVAFIGDDLNDLECMNMIKIAGGLTGCPLDASRKIKEVVDFVANNCGGDGAVRDFIEWIVNNKVL